MTTDPAPKRVLLAAAVALALTGPLSPAASATGIAQKGTLPTSATVKGSIKTAAAPSGQVNRYVIPNYFSTVTGVSRSFTGITVFNNSSANCSVAISFQKGQSTANSCVVNNTIPPKQGRRYCSRQPGSGGTFTCEASCDLNSDAGHAFISSTNSIAACASIAVDAQVIYTTDSTDSVVAGLTRLSVNKVNQATIGD